MNAQPTWAIVPLKPFHAAKRRLAPVLSAAQRAALSRAMFQDLVAAVHNVATIDTLCVVSGEASLEAGEFRLLRDPRGASLNDAVRHAIDYAVRHGAGTCCVLHADLPLASAEAIAELLARHRTAGDRSVTLVPDATREGTNVLLCTPGDALPLHYGQGSLAAHAAAARTCALVTDIVPHATLGLDIDDPCDLRTAQRKVYRQLAGPRTQAVLERLDVARASRRSA